MGGPITKSIFEGGWANFEVKSTFDVAVGDLVYCMSCSHIRRKVWRGSHRSTRSGSHWPAAMWRAWKKVRLSQSHPSRGKEGSGETILMQLGLEWSGHVRPIGLQLSFDQTVTGLVPSCVNTSPPDGKFLPGSQGYGWAVNEVGE